MPRYQFQCRSCGHSFERRMSIEEREKEPPSCPECESAEVDTVPTPFFAKTESKS